jgi:hypothetical protein
VGQQSKTRHFCRIFRRALVSRPAIVFNPKTQHISPQYHVIFDDKFSTVPSLHLEAQRNETWAELFKQEKNEIFIDPDDLTSSRSLLQDDWLTEDEV